MMSEVNSVTQLHDWLIEAAETERRLPPAWRKQATGFWPECLPEWGGYADPGKHNTLGKPSGVEIDRFDKIMLSISTLPSIGDRKLLWSVAHSAAFRMRGPAWLKLSRLLRCDRRTVKARYTQALANLYYLVKDKL